MSGKLLEVKNLVTEFHTEDEIVKAVNGVSFNLEKLKTLGIVGFGTIGQIVAENAGNLGMNLIGNDTEISDDDEIWGKLNVRCSSFEDVISLFY